MDKSESRVRRQEALTMLAGAMGIQSEFLRTAVEALAHGLDCLLAAVGEANQDKTEVRLLIMLNDGKFVEPYTYKLAGTPCADIYTSRETDPHVFHGSGLCALFPEDTALVSLGAEGYRAEAIYSPDGECNGHVFVIDNKNIDDDPDDMAFFRLISQRIGAEINRWHAEAELKNSEEKFRALAEIGNDWFWETDKDDRVTFVSDRFQGVTGLDPSIYIGRSRREFSKESENAEMWEQHMSVLENHLPFRGFIHDVTTSDGRKLTVSSSARPVFDDDQNFLGYYGTATDVSEQRRAEEARDEALVEAEQANHAKSDFLATMSHELRTPLNAIIGFSEMIEAEYFGALGSVKYKEYARDIHSSSEHLLSLINDILDLSAIEAGQQPLTKEDLKVEDLVADCTPIISNASCEKKVAFSVELPDNLPPLYADRRAVKQILLNLLSNAVKYTPEGGKILLKITPTDEFHTFEVRDTGIGVPAEKLSTLTNPFVRTESDPHQPQEGSGLGLAIVKSLVDLHGGELNIKSEVGRGTSVEVKLPS